MKAAMILLALAVLPNAAAATRVVEARGQLGGARFSATVTGEDRTPRAGVPWRWVVRARDANGRAVGGTVVVRVLVAGRVVDTVGWFGFDGWLSRRYRWSPKLRGSSAVFQAKVIGPGATRTVSYAVRVR